MFRLGQVDQMCFVPQFLTFSLDINLIHLSRNTRKPSESAGFLMRSDTNLPVHSQKKARHLKFRILGEGIVLSL